MPGQFYGLSRPVADYIVRNAGILHRYANEDVSVGTWLLGLDVQHVHERLMCCDSAAMCREQTSPARRCLAYLETACAGVCQAERRLEPIFHACIEQPYRAKELATF